MNKEEKQYPGYRQYMLVVSLFSLINVILIYFRIDSSFYFSAFIPLVASVSSIYYLKGSLQIFVFVFLVVFFILMLFVCWLASKRNYKWLLAGAVIYALDSAFMVYYIILTGFEAQWILDIVFHAFLLVMLFRGAFIGKAESEAAKTAEQEPEHLEEKETPDEDVSEHEIEYQVLDDDNN